MPAQDLSKKIYSINSCVGVDLAKGLRVGLLYHFQEHFSVEASCGIDIVNLIIMDHYNRRYSFGINWHKGNESNMLIGVAYSHSDFTTTTITRQNFISANIGSLLLNKKGLQFYYKFGFLIRVKKNNAGDFTNIFPNIDIGLSLNIL